MNPSARQACTAESFESRYRRSPDPWHFSTSAYELARYQLTLAALPRDHYSRAFEPGCSIGELTARLAPRCGHLLASDISPTSVDLARQRCASFHNVHIECADVRDAVLQSQPDLIVLSELAYYFDCDELARLAARLGETLCNGGTLIAVHWLGSSPDHVLHGDEVHEILQRELPLHHVLSQRHDGFRLDRWAKKSR
jgi:SAM-dependent methyltransferase